KIKKPQPEGEARNRRKVNRTLLCFDWLDHYKLAHGPAIHELDPPGNFGEKSVIFPTSNIQPRLYPSSTLTHDDRPTGDKLSAERFKSKPLRVRVAPIS